MNKKDIAHIRRQFKLDHDLLKVFEILNVYILKESDEIYHYECRPFAMLEREQQELYMGNFRKLLSGEPDRKLFAVKFRQDPESANEAVHTQLILHQALLSGHTEEWVRLMLQIVENMLAGATYERDTVVTFIRGEYFKPTRSWSEESMESERDEVGAHRYILCSINSAEPSQNALLFDYVEKEFKYHVVVDPVIKLASPEAGFFFPAIADNVSDVNRVLYCAGKANAPDAAFIEDVLGAQRSMTAQEEKDIFEEVVREVAGERLDAGTLAQVYEEIHRVIEENEEEDEPPKLDARDVERVLQASGVERATAEKVEEAFRNAAGETCRELKAGNVLPKFTSKSVKIETSVATITLSPQDLKYVRQVQYQGKRCIMIEIDEDAVIEGFTLDTAPLPGQEN